MRVAYIVSRVGPYHAARLRRVSEELDLTIIQFYEHDTTYQWRQEILSGLAVTTLSRDQLGATTHEMRAALRSALNMVRPEVVCIPGYSESLALAAVCWCVDMHVPAVLMSDTQAVDAIRISYREWLKAAAIRSFSTAFVAGSSHRDYLQTLGMEADRIFLGYDVVDNAYFSAAAGMARRDPGMRQALGLPTNFFLACARFVEKKNLRLLIRAYAKYRQEAAGEPWALVIAGDGPLRRELETLTCSLSIAAAVMFPGFLQYDQLPAFYGSAGAFIHVSIVEQWGLVVNEAMASGLPVVVSRTCGCAPDLVRDGVNGFVVDPADEEGIAVRLQTLADATAEERAGMSRASEAIIAEWSLDRFALGLRNACSAAVHDRRSPAGGNGILLEAMYRIRAFQERRMLRSTPSC